MSRLLSRLKQYRRKHALAMRLIAYIVICSTVLAFIATGLQLYLEYNSAVKGIDAQFQQIKKSNIESLSRSLWEVDNETLNLQLKGLLQLPNIEYIKLTTSTDNIHEFGQIPPQPHQISNRYAINYYHDKNYQLGELQIIASKRELYTELLDKAIIILLTQTAKTFLVSIIILMIFNHLVTRHLYKMAQFSRNLTLKNIASRLSLNRQSRASDELDYVVESINSMQLKMLEDTRDIEEAKQQAVDANSAKDRFLATMSHEIRTPLNGITGMCSILQDSQLTDEQQEHAETILKCANSLLAILNNMLDLAVINIDQLDINEEAFAVNELLSQAKLLMTPLVGDKDIKIQTKIDLTPPHEYIGDAKRILQIILNLVNNAIQFTDKGSITVSLQRSSSVNGVADIHWSVTDTGMGIEQEKLQSIFQHFTQIDASAKRKIGGIGVGLAICKQLAEKMGGHIDVSSSPGKGSCFTLILQLKEAGTIDSCKHNQDSPDSTGIVAVAGQNVLVAEDNMINAIIAKKMLEKMGYNVDIAEDGVIALQQHEKNRYDLIIMDCQMTNMDGYETTERIRTMESDSSTRTPIIALTANAMTGDEEKCIAAGMDAYLTKPVDFAKLKSVIVDTPCPISSSTNMLPSNNPSKPYQQGDQVN